MGTARLSETGHAILEMTERLLAHALDDNVMRSARAGVWPEAAWQAATDQGIPLALVEGDQGFGLSLADGLSIVRELGRRAVPLPLAETMIANAILARAGAPVVDGVAGIVPDNGGAILRRRGAGWHASGETDRVAWGRNADALLIEAGGHMALMTSHFRLGGEGCNVAAMPRDRMVLDGPVKILPSPGISLLEAGALMRALAMAGAMQALVALTVRHVTERKQFGRSLSAFQAIQHLLARLAAETAAASAAADLASSAFADASAQTGTAIAAARSRIGEAAGIAIGIAHQLHGAIGFTEEHRLHWFTTALWAWRDEFGSAAWWTRRLGAQALGQPQSAYWPLVTSV